MISSAGRQASIRPGGMASRRIHATETRARRVGGADVMDQTDSGQGREASVRFRRAAGLALVGAVAAVEIGLRLVGFSPFDPEGLRRGLALRVEPGGKLAELDPVVGFRNAPGTFSLSFRGRSWKTTHNPDGSRAAPDDARAAGDRPEIWAMGCSFTHGFGVEDGETFCARLQETLPGRRIVNRGVDGYSDVQALLAYREAAARSPPPEVVILGYADVHDVRNTLSRSWQAQLSLVNTTHGEADLPYGRLNGRGELEIDRQPLTYRPIPLGGRSSLLTLIDRALSMRETASGRPAEVTDATIARFAREVEGSGARFLLAVVRGGEGSAERFARMGIRSVLVDPTRMNRPGGLQEDGHHPDADGHARIADDVYLALHGWLFTATDGRRAWAGRSPEPGAVRVAVVPDGAGVGGGLVGAALERPILAKAGTTIEIRFQARAAPPRTIKGVCVERFSPRKERSETAAVAVDGAWREYAVRLAVEPGDPCTVVALRVGEGDGTLDVRDALVLCDGVRIDREAAILDE
jgi:hypothetical protein